MDFLKLEFGFGLAYNTKAIRSFEVQNVVQGAKHKTNQSQGKELGIQKGATDLFLQWSSPV